MYLCWVLPHLALHADRPAQQFRIALCDCQVDACSGTSICIFNPHHHTRHIIPLGRIALKRIDYFQDTVYGRFGRQAFFTGLTDCLWCALVDELMKQGERDATVKAMRRREARKEADRQ